MFFTKNMQKEASSFTEFLLESHGSKGASGSGRFWPALAGAGRQKRVAMKSGRDPDPTRREIRRSEVVTSTNSLKLLFPDVKTRIFLLYYTCLDLVTNTGAHPGKLLSNPRWIQEGRR